MKLKKVVLVVDHKNRDLDGIALIAHHLYTKHNIFPHLTTTKNEISSLIKYQPELILIQHVRHEHQREFLTYCKEKGIKIALSLAEGFPRQPRDIIFSIGKKEFIPMLDLIMPWGRTLSHFCKNSPLTTGVTISETGAPRFDFHSRNLANRSQARERVCKALSLEKNRKIVLWTTNYKYANHPHLSDKELIELIKTPTTSDHRIAETIEKKVHDHNLCRQKTSESILKLVTNFPNVNFIVKLHPSESQFSYKQYFENCSNVDIFRDHDDLHLSDLLLAVDVQIGWRCTTSAESWLSNINTRTIDYEPDGLLLDEFSYLSSGNEYASNYSELQNRLTYYLCGGTVSQELIEIRRNFVADFLYSDDGKSAERCADTINQFLVKQPNKYSTTLRSSSIFFRHLKDYRFNKGWVALHRSSSHDKYISRKEVDRSMQRCSRAYNETAEYAFL